MTLDMNGHEFGMVFAMFLLCHPADVPRCSKMFGFEAGSSDGLNLDQFEQLCQGTLWWGPGGPILPHEFPMKTP